MTTLPELAAAAVSQAFDMIASWTPSDALAAYQADTPAVLDDLYRIVADLHPNAVRRFVAIIPARAVEMTVLDMIDHHDDFDGVSLNEFDRRLETFRHHLADLALTPLGELLACSTQGINRSGERYLVGSATVDQWNAAQGFVQCAQMTLQAAA